MKIAIPDWIIALVLLLGGAALGFDYIRENGFSDGVRLPFIVAIVLIPGVIVLYLNHFSRGIRWRRIIGWIAVGTSIFCSCVLYCIARWYCP